MNKRTVVFLLLLLLMANSHAVAQKPFTEGVIVYNISMETPEHSVFKGVYTFTIKGSEIKKELKLNNGYEDIVIMNCGNDKAYSLQSKNGKKYVIQLSLHDLEKKQERFAGYTISNEKADSKICAGIAATKGDVRYKNGVTDEVYFTSEWYPVESITFEGFPGSKFLPLCFSFRNDQGMLIKFEAAKVEAKPVDNAAFRIPHDYQMISYKEYQELSR